MAGFGNDNLTPTIPINTQVMFADNVDFSGAAIPAATVVSDGQLLIGASSGQRIRVNTLTQGPGITITNAPGSITIGLAGGGAGIDSVAMQTGTSPVVPDGAGLVTFNGASVAAGTNPVRTNGTGANTMQLEVQRAQAVASADTTTVGLANFENAQFTVSDGFVSLLGSGAPAATDFDTDSVGNVTPVAGEVNVFGQNGTPGATTGITVLTDAADTMLVRMLTPYSLGDFEFRSAVSGATRTLSVTNTSDTASSQATFLHSVAGTSAGDTWSQFNIGTTRSYSLGIDNSASDTLKITTDGDGTVDPSSGTHAAGFTTIGGVELGPNASATTDTNSFVTMRKDQNDTSQARVVNTTNGTASVSKFVVDVGGTTSGSLRAMSAAYTVDATLADRVSLNSDDSASGLDITRDSGSANLRFMSVTTSQGNVSAAGEWTYPLQPSFAAYNSVSDANQTGNGATVTVQFDTELFDRGSDFASNTFTAPVNGIYFFTSHVYCSNIASMETFALDLVIAGDVSTAKTFRVEQSNNIDQNRSIQLSTYANMTAGDTAIIRLTISGGAGNTATITGSGSTGGLLMTTFSGKLVA